MIITIGGLAGTGTTTAAELLSEKMGIDYISVKDKLNWLNLQII